MTYEEIITNNCQYHSPTAWWPKFAYHYTDITNAVSILNSGYLYSRENANHLGLMSNENASRQVIDVTRTEALSSARFYFRPLTPTQYYNEGYKHPKIRYSGDEYANIPVPVFLLFDLASVLRSDGVRFSERRQSGYGSPLLEGVEAFSRLNFDYIYSKGAKNFAEEKDYRHAEILGPPAFPIEGSIRNILCRNEIEQTTLLNLLKEKNRKAYNKYKAIIKVCREDMFECNGFFITACRYHDNSISITFADTYAKKRYTEIMTERYGVESLAPLRLQVNLDWILSLTSKDIARHFSTVLSVSYDLSNLLLRDVPFVQHAKALQIRISIDDHIMCFVEPSLEIINLMK